MQASDQNFRPVFVIEEQDYKQVFEFVLDDNGNPTKLGDGSHGAVYRVRRNEEDLAVKLFYNEPLNTRTSAVEFTGELTKKFIESFELQKDFDLIKSLQKIEGMYDSFTEFAFELGTVKLNKDQFSFVANHCQEASDSRVKFRYEHEKKSVEIIRKKIREQGDYDALKGVIEIIGGTDTFRSSDAYKILQQKFSEAQMSISDFAIVMPLYKFTLKELLVRSTNNFAIRPSKIKDLLSRSGAPTAQLQRLGGKIFSKKNELVEEIRNFNGEDDVKEELQNGIYELKGYDLLKAMGYSDRISTILPYLLDISQGLMALHLAGKFHYDLKPANIFVRSGSGGEVDAVIGDLGFFMISDDQDKSTYDTTTHESLPLGTRHYRSPEQKDYFDICDVKIDADGNLIIKDPKFEDTIIEAGDYVVFSRDSTREKYYIERIEFYPEWSKVFLIMPDEKSKKLQKDNLTQCLFYKQQRLRTDLFGFGAVVYDMLTGGKSPERFYDKIRNFDKGNEDVNNILDKYKQVSNYQVTDPSLIHIFSDFKNEEKADYAPEEVVQLILMCMLYKAKNTYYQLHKEKVSKNGEYYHSMDDIFRKLRTFDVSRGSENKWDNHLIKMTYPGYRGQRQSIYLENSIYGLQEIGVDSISMRLAQGYWFFRKLAELTREILEDKDNAFIVELLPKNIIVDKDRLKYVFTAYKSEEDYKSDLRQDLVYARVSRDINNPFVPNDLTFMRRRVQLRKTSEEDQFEYQFIESALLGDKISVGDWIIVGSELYRIDLKEENFIVIKSDEQKIGESKSQLSPENQDEKSSEHVFYHNLDPCRYYLQMLGIYLYHIFFVGIGSTTKNKPLIITIADSARYLSDLPEPVHVSRFEHVDKKDYDLQSIYRFLIHIYLKLLFGDHSESYYRQETDDRQRILAVLEDINKLQEITANVMGIRSVELDTPALDAQTEKTILNQNYSDKIDPENFEFDHLVRSVIDISLDKRKRRWKKISKSFKKLMASSPGSNNTPEETLPEQPMENVESTENEEV